MFEFTKKSFLPTKMVVEPKYLSIIFGNTGFLVYFRNISILGLFLFRIYSFYYKPLKFISMKRLLPLLFISLFQINAFSQTFEEKQIITKDYNTARLEELAKSFKTEADHKKTNAIKLAKQNDWALRYEEDGKLFELMSVSEEGLPLYYTTNNVNAAKSTRANTLHNGGILGLNVVGQNMEAHVWDGGLARGSHQEYDGAGGSNRFSIGDGTTTLHYHSAHVTGTIIASGYVSNAKGMAPQADAIGYDWDYDVSEATSAANSGMLLSNHSYGWGASTIPDWYFGAYNYRSREWDVVMHNAPYYLMVVSAGNDGDDNTSNGNPLDGNSSYDKLSGFKTSKNNITVANGQDANIDANGNLISVYINSSSSEGPTDDYRIKPDITGNGTSLYSTFEGYNSEYGNLTGTSMAAPNVTGTLLLLQQHYNNTNASYMKAATLKGLALHTADDAGPSGPDSKYGWGLLNAKEAANTITNEGVESTISELGLNNGNSYTINVNSDGINDLVASISWTDPAGQSNTGTANDPDPVLVNDLDIRVTKGGSTHYPYRLTSITTNGTGDNIVDPYEKIIVSGASGSYTITVTHKGNLSGGNQNFSLIVTGLTISSSPPVANFNADDTAPIIGQTVTFTDLSTNSPTSWQWTFSGPGNIVFVNGTNANSTNPKVQFDALGFYTATLTVSNAYGNDTETKTNYIEVVEAGALDPPTNLTAQVINEDDVLLNWTAPSGGGGQGEWIQWDDGVNAGNGIGLTAGGTFYVASHWNPSDLTGYNGMTVNQMSFFPLGDPNATFTLKIWTGANAATEVMSQNVGSYTVDDFNIVNLNNPITINPSTEYWFGYEVTHAEGTNPAGVDAGPAVQEMGDMISFGSNSWTGMSAAYGLDFNWNIAIYVDDSKNATPPQAIIKTTYPVSNGTFKENGATGTIKTFNPNPTKALTGYNIYRDGVFIGYTTQTTYTNSNLENGTYDYCATAVYDEGESNCSNTASATISTGGALNPPTNLTAQIVNEDDVLLNWTAPSGGGGEGEWIQWDDGINVGNGIGLTSGGTFYVASHWMPSNLTGYIGKSVAQ
ncbi:MAG: peptidase S8, partial [Bacteroidetes bacterium]